MQSHLVPGHVHHEQHGHISEQRERQPFQEKHVAIVGHENLQDERHRHEHRGHDVPVDSGHERAGLSHGGEIRGDIERVGDEQREYDAAQHERRKRILDVGRESLAGGAAD